jgi:hypothetical protein
VLLQGCASPGAEASTNLDLADLAPLLKSVQQLIQSGFGDAEAGQINAMARSMPVGQTKELKFQTVFHGTSTILRLQVKKTMSTPWMSGFLPRPNWLPKYRKP